MREWLATRLPRAPLSGLAVVDADGAAAAREMAAGWPRVERTEVYVLLIGPPGAGKGTQGARIARHFGIRHIAAGDLLRSEVAANTELGRNARRYIESGELVPDDVVVGMVLPILTDAHDEGGFLLDGFPRTVAQAVEIRRLFDAYLAETASDRDVSAAVVYLEVARHHLIARLLERATREGRADDTSEIIAHRLAVFDDATLPLVDHFRRLGLLRIADATGTEDEVTESVLKALGYRPDDLGSGW
jgi:adenylate kinase